MINVKQAVAAASDFMRDLYEVEELIDFTLEEVELSEDETDWLVTFGFTRRLTEPISEKITQFHPTDVFGLFNDKNSEISSKYSIRNYKVIPVDANTGIPKSMKIREI